MAQYEHLPVFKKSYDLLLAVYQSVGMFGKEYKYTIGENLKKMIFLNEFIESISKQLTGWEKAVIQSNAGVAPVKAGASVPYQSNSPPRLGGGKFRYEQAIRLA